MSRLAIVLAAGKGTRMNSDLPKVLHPVCGRAIIHWVLDALREVGVTRLLVVIGYQSDRVRQELAEYGDIEFVEQTEQLGTGHAVKMCVPLLSGGDGAVLIVCGDSPLIQTSSLNSLFTEFDRMQPACILGTLQKDDPRGLGRIVRDANGDFLGIVEEKDATDAQRAIKEVNMSTYLFDCPQLLEALEQLRNDNRQGEYYVTDCPGILKNAGRDVRALPVLKDCEALSINTVEELGIVELEMQKLGYSNGAPGSSADR